MTMYGAVGHSSRQRNLLVLDGMDITGFLASLESSNLATGIRDSLYVFPLIESLHVLGLTMVFGTMLIVDLRLLGIASIRRPFTSITSDIMKWTWASFIWTAATGVLMFITNASVYYHNFFSGPRSCCSRLQE